MNVDYYNRQDSFLAEVDYADTPSDLVRAFIEMCDCLRGGGWCVLAIGNQSQMITKLHQLLPLEKGWDE